MPTFTLALPPGISSDDTTFDQQGRYADCNNVRFYLGKPQTVGGRANYSAGLFNGVAKLLAYKRSGTVFIASAGAQLRSIHPTSGVADNITPAGWTGGSSTGRYSLTMWGDVLLANHSGFKLYQSVGGAVATHVSQAPANITTIIVTPHRQVLAVGCNEEVTGTFNSRCIRWCDFEDLTSWMSTPTNNAGEHILGGQAAIVGARLVGEHVLIWTEAAMYLGSFVGDPAQSWRFDRIADTGLIAHDAHTVHNQTVYWLAPDLRVRSYTIGGVVEAISCPISREFTTNCSRTYLGQIFAFTNSKFGEIWFCYPDTRDGNNAYATRYIAFCEAESRSAQMPVWFRGIEGLTAVVDDPLLTASYAAHGTSIAIARSLGNVPYAYDSTVFPNDSWHIQTAEQHVDQGTRRVMLRSVTPDFKEQIGDVDLTLYVRSAPQDTPITKGPFTLSATTTKTACRCSGRLVSAKFSSSSTVQVRFGRPVFDIVTLGER